MSAAPELVRAARRTWGALETLHVVGYFAEEPVEEYVALGLHDRLSYFAARGAALGPVGPRVTEATFYVFAPWLHDAALPAAWDHASPAQLVAARRRGMTRALARTVGDPDVTEALGLARRLAEGLAATPGSAAGRPLYAAHLQLDWPEHPLLALWHAATLVREHRGDGHVALLTARGIGPVEATVLDGAWAGKERFLRSTRGWSDAELAAAEAGLRERGWLEPDATGGAVLTDLGRREREDLESATDLVSLAGWEALGLEDTVRLGELLAPVRRSVLDSGVLPRRLGNLGSLAE
ncbi:SCO6745 family protein [Nocardioides aurantiacus]|uniref:SCO6745 family protein n=1 Tax=Nocardioides aurantiacus TaxID=86796 RepID=UPI00403F6AE7